MSDDKKIDRNGSDGLAELMNAFGGYVEGDESDDVALNREESDSYTPDEIAIELPEIPLEEAVSEDIENDEASSSSDGGFTVAEADAEEPNTDKTEGDNKTDSDADVSSNSAYDEQNSAEAAEVSVSDKADTKLKDKSKKGKKADRADVNKSADKKSDKKSDKKKEKKKEIRSDKSDKKAETKHKKEKTQKNKTVTSDKKTVKEKKVKSHTSEKSNAEVKKITPVRIVAVLTVICAAVALLLASVNHLTEAKIAENTEKVMLTSIREIFDDSVDAEQVALPEDSELTSVYLVIKNGGVCGYAASVSPSGFGGPVNLMVGVDSNGTVMGVEVVSMSETPGLGSRVGGEDFLSQFDGKSGELSVDAISGATISSKAVMAGVNSVTADLLDLNTLAAKISMPVVAYDRDESVPETTVPVTEAPEQEENAVVPEAPEVTAPLEETDVPGTEALPVAPDVPKEETPPEVTGKNPNNENPGIHAEYREDTAEYETLTTEPETSELTDNADEN